MGFFKWIFVLFGTSMITSGVSTDASVSEARGDMLSEMEYSDVATEIDQYTEEHSDALSGMAVSVFDDEGIICDRYYGYADRENAQTVDENTVFEWGSSSKTLVWVSVMQQIERGNINPDADIEEYLPERFLTNRAYSKPVTMTNLMNHDAGYQELAADLMLGKEYEVPSLAEALKKYEPVQVYEPGTVTAYSNWGTALAAYVVERVSGQDFSDYVHDNIFAPLGMEHTAIAVNLADNEWVAAKREELKCYRTDGELIPDAYRNVPLYPVGGCTSTLADYRTWGMALAGRDSRILSADGWNELYTPTSFYTNTDKARNCHGFWSEYYSVATLGHGGNTQGCSSYIRFDPVSGLGMAVMTNVSNETVFNYDMAKVVFGETDRNGLNDPSEYTGKLFKSLRSSVAGPCKILGTGFSTGDEMEDGNAVVENGEIKRIECLYHDETAISWKKALFETGLFLGTIAGILVLIVIVVSRLIYDVVRLIRKRKSGVLAGWQYAVCGVCLASAGLFAYFISQLGMLSAPFETFRWSLYPMPVFMILMAVLLVYGLIKMIKTPSSNKGKVLNSTLLILDLFALVVMAYFQIWKFWIV